MLFKKKNMAQIKSDEAYIIGAAQKRFRDEYRKKKKRKKRLSAVLWAFWVIVLTFMVFNVGFIVSENQSTGMSGHIGEGDIVVTNRLAFTVHKPQRGEIVTIYSGNESGESAYVCKRVIGLPGDEIDFENGNVYVNGDRCIETYVSGTTQADVAHVIVPEGSYYVLNDDREDMSDSRSVSISSSNIAGSEIAVIYVPEFIQNNHVYQSVRKFCKQGARVFADVMNPARLRRVGACRN